MSGKVLPPVFNIVHYKLRITTASVHLCVQILSAHLFRSISGCSSGIVIVLPSHHRFHHIFHILSTVIGATGRAEVARSVVDSQGHALSEVGSLDGTNPDGNKSGQKQSVWKQMDRQRVVLLRMSI